MWKNETQSILTVVFGLVILAASTYAVSRCTAQEPRHVARADVIAIDTLAQHGQLERPPATFLHDRHARALQKQGKDCGTCHKIDSKGYYSRKFLHLEDMDRQALQDLFHTECVACHRETGAAGLKTGPMADSDCGVCHQRRPLVMSSWTLIQFDKSLHYRHAKASGKKCDQCHHVYDDSSKELVYRKGEERSCRDCHGEESEENRESLELVAHKQCISCHLKLKAENRSSGPFACEGCHDKQKQMGYTMLEDVPRLDSGQPDVAFLRPVDVKGSHMQTVPFNHAFHEEMNDTCRVCHHDSLKACKECHTLSGDEKGEGVTLAQAMHATASEHSCLGCHNKKKAEKGCDGCHSLMKQEEMKETGCSICHAGPLPDDPVLAGPKPDTLPTKAFGKLTWEDKDVPTEIKIGVVEKEYEPSKFPHRKIISALMKKITGSRLARYFHGNEDTACKSCHHHNPAGKKPIACSSCHSRTDEGASPGMPDLKSAYHLQCIGCHNAMGLPNLSDCEACHKKKNPEAGSRESE